MPFTVMSFNIRYDEPADGRHAWRHRRDAVISLIRAHDPDLLGLQEPMRPQWQEIAAALPEWASFGEISDEEGWFDPHGGFIRRARFDVRDTGVFWLSDTPQETGSVSFPNDWGSRACGWARVHDRRTGRALVFACTHFDTNAGSWLPSARVLHAELDKVAAADPVILAGDFNCAAGADAHRYLCGAARFRDSWTEAGRPDDGVVTFNGFRPVTSLGDAEGDVEPSAATASGGDGPFDRHASQVSAHRNYRIDWILLRGPLACVEAAIDCRHDDGLLPSDHYPVIAEVEWQEECGAGATE
jgi:endonuclease/exonuclease/phosphatase family metal-dependent hydrolase